MAHGYPSCVISSSWDESIRIWKVDECFSAPKEHGDKVVCVKDSWKILRGHTNRICCVKVFDVYPSHTGPHPLIASGSTDGSIKIWNFKRLENKDFNTDCLFTIFDELNITWYLCLEFLYTAEDGHVLISGSKDNFVRVRNTVWLFVFVWVCVFWYMCCQVWMDRCIDA
jgi:WD40 repeat protein